jgi:hypothetical protein
VIVGSVPFPEVEVVADVVLERFDWEDITVPESGGWLPEPPLVENSRALAREIVRFLTLCSASSTELTVRDSSLAWSSSPWLFADTIDADDTLRALFRASATSRSSDKLPYGVNCGCSDGCVSAEARASRVGNGVKFRT